jgi:RNA polymerase sigma-70 factor (ECF subfamily)
MTVLPDKNQTDKQTDEALVFVCKSRTDQSHAAFETLVKRYMKKVYYHCRSICGAHDDADDAAQNTFIKAWQNLSSFRGDSLFYTWIYRIATNESLTVIRRKKPYISLDDMLPDSEPMAATNDITEDKMLALLEKAIATLPIKQRLVFNLKYFEDLSYKDIVEITGTSEGALKSSYHLAVKKIEAIIGKSV